jgi:hypothetical protein
MLIILVSTTPRASMNKNGRSERLPAVEIP